MNRHNTFITPFLINPVPAGECAKKQMDKLIKKKSYFLDIDNKNIYDDSDRSRNLRKVPSEGHFAPHLNKKFSETQFTQVSLMIK